MLENESIDIVSFCKKKWDVEIISHLETGNVHERDRVNLVEEEKAKIESGYFHVRNEKLHEAKFPIQFDLIHSDTIQYQGLLAERAAFKFDF